MTPARSLALLAALSCTATAHSQDMIAVAWNGDIYSLDSYSGVFTPIGTGLFGQNAIARDASGTLWTNSWASSPTSVESLARLDHTALVATAVFPSEDIRAMAAGPGTTLYAAVFEALANSSAFYTIDTATGLHTRVGATGAARIQGMTMYNGTIYASDLALGIGTIDPQTGVFTDLPGPPSGGQWLAVRDDGVLILGDNDLRTVDPVTGTTTIYATNIPFCRGAERAAFAVPFGTGCQGGTGQVSLAVRGSLKPGSLFTSQSVGHTNNGGLFSGMGALIIGTDTSVFGTSMLPLLLDPWLGTQGCSLYTSIDVSAMGTTTLGSAVQLQFVLPLPSGLPQATLHLQHVGFDSVPGGISTSNAVMVRIAN